MKKILFTGTLLLLVLQIFAQNVQVDPSFGQNGFVFKELDNGRNLGPEFARKCFIQPDNKLLVVLDLGGLIVINRRLSNGENDPTFGSKGFSVPVRLNQPAAAQQADGKIVVAGASSYDNSDFLIARYNNDGSLDPSFGNGGVVSSDIGSSDDAAFALSIQQDGKLLVGGRSTRNGSSQFAITRFEVNGQTDLSFGNNGIVITDFGSPSVINAMALQSDGKIVAAGNVFDGVNGDFAVARYNMNGSPDLSFNLTGRKLVDLGNTDNAKSIIIQTDNKIVLGGYSVTPDYENNFSIVRLLTDGSIDNSFNGNGIVSIDFQNTQDFLETLLLQPDGNILLGGYTLTDGVQDFAIARITNTGELDISFGNGGKQITDLSNSQDFINTLALQSNGEIIAVGYSWINFNYDFSLVRYDVSGNTDPLFGTEGKVIAFYPKSSFAFENLFRQNDGKLVVYGSTFTDVGVQTLLFRYNANGSPDSSYGQDGVVVLNNNIFAAMQTDGKIVAASYLFSETGSDIVLSRITINGTPDSSFGINGTVISDFGGSEFQGPVAIQADGKIVVSGYLNNDVGTDLLLVRYNSDGSLDMSFGDNGKVITDFDIQEFTQAIAVGNDGRIIVSGYSLNYPPDFSYIYYNIITAAYDSFGNPDPGFGQGGKLVTDMGSQEFTGGIAIKPDGKILLNYFAGENYPLATFIRRLNSDGTIDASFAGSGTISVNGMLSLLQPDQKFLVAGNFTTPQNDVDFSMERYKEDGEPDSSFGVSGKVITHVTSGDDNINKMVMTESDLFVAGSSMSISSVGTLVKYKLETSVTLTCPSNKTAYATADKCSAIVTGIDPLVVPANNSTVINYKLTGATVGTGTGSVSGKIFNKGVTEVKYSLAADTSKFCVFSITVLDTVKPVIENLRANPNTLWPANHQLEDVFLTYEKKDNCGIASTSVTITSNEPVMSNENSDRSPDWVIVSNHYIKLRAERLNSGNGRIYTITVRCTDFDGNSTSRSVTVTVPKKHPGATPELIVKVSPNPTVTGFGVEINSNYREEKLVLRILDVKGFEIKRIENVFPNTRIAIGSELHAGVYFLEVTQAATVKTVKLIKY